MARLYFGQCSGEPWDFHALRAASPRIHPCLLDAPGLWAVIVDVKLNAATGQVRAVIVRPEYEVSAPPPGRGVA